MNDNDNKISKEQAIEIGHDFLVHRHQLLRERILRTEGQERLEKLYVDATFEFQNIFEEAEVWEIDFRIKPAKGMIEPNEKEVFVNKTTGEFGFRTA